MHELKSLVVIPTRKTVLFLFFVISPSVLFGSAEIFDPTQDGWKSEAASSLLQKKLKYLVAGYLKHHELDSSIVNSKSTAALLTTANFDLSERDKLFRRRSLKLSAIPLQSNSPFRVGFDKILERITNTTQNTEPPFFRLKVSEIKIQGTSAKTKVLFYAASQGKGQQTQVNSTWLVHWNILENSEKVSLQALDILSHEELTLKGQQKWFSDATLALFKNDRGFTEQLQKGINTWLAQVERYAGSNIYSRHGLAIGDANGDGLDDLYVCQPGGLPNRLFLKQKDGTLVDHSHASGLDWLNDTRSALFVDLDNDGDQDLVLGTFVGVYLCENTGDGSYEKKGKLKNIERDISSLSAVDYDNDGLLDLHVCIYWDDSNLYAGPGAANNVYDLQTKGGTNRLFKNKITPSGNWDFADVTDSSGLMEGNKRFTLAASWEDFDQDGDQDLYIANDFGINCLYRNDGKGRFDNVAKELGVEDYGPGMSVSWGDFNRDGNPDLYVANMFSSAGNRIVPQDQFKINKDLGLTTESFLRFNKGNSLYSFNGETFDEMPQANGAENALWAWSSLLVDIDNDGWQDSLVANGYITGPGGGDL